MTTLNLDTRKNIKDTFDDASSYPRKYVIISILILYIIINLIEYYIAQTSPIDNSPSGKKILTKNELLSNALFVLKNVSLVILILCILSLVDPIPIVTNIIFGKTLNSKKYLHILDILNKYIVNTHRTNDVYQDYDRLKQVSEDLQEHITKLNTLVLYDSNNQETSISDIINNLSIKVNSNWKKIQNKYWLPVNENVTKFRDYIKRSDALELIERRFYVEGGIFQSEMTYNIKVLEKIGSNPDLINYFFITNLVYNLNNSSILEIYGCLIEYYYESKMLNPTSDSGYLEAFEKTIKSLCLNNNLNENVKDIIKIFKSSRIFTTETNLNNRTLNYYTQFTKNIYINNSRKLDTDFVNEFNITSEIKINMHALVESLYNSMIKKFPYLTKKHIFLTKEAYEMHNASGISDMNIKSAIDYSKFKDLHLNKKIGFIREKLASNNEILDEINSSFFNKIKSTYTQLTSNNIDDIFNWFKGNINNNKEEQYYSYLHLLNSTKLNDTKLQENVINNTDEITNTINQISNYIRNKVNNFALNNKFPDKTALDKGIDIKKILKNLTEIIDDHVNENITDETEKYTHLETIVSAEKILAFIKKKSYSPWVDTHIKLKTAAMIYQLKLKLINEEKWDHLANPLPYKDYDEIVKEVEKFTRRVTTLLEEKQAYELSQSVEGASPQDNHVEVHVGGEFTGTLSSEEFRIIEKINSKITTYVNDINLEKMLKKNYILLQTNINSNKKIVIENKLDNPNDEAEQEMMQEIIKGEQGDEDGDQPPPEPTTPAAEVLEPSDVPPTENLFGGSNTKHDLNSLQTDCNNGISQIENIEKMRLDIINGLNYDIKSFNDAFFNTDTKHPIIILNINIGNIFCILFNIVYLLLVLKSKREFQGYKKFSIYSFYAVSMLYVLNYDKTLKHIMNNIQICKFAPYLIIFRTILYIYMTMYDDYTKTAYDVNDESPFELSMPRNSDSEDGTTEENKNKRMFIAAKLLSSSADLITLILLILIVLNYIKPIVLSKHCNDIIEIFDFDIESNSIRNKIPLNFSITDNYEWNKTIFNTHPFEEKLLVLYDNMNLNNHNRIYFYVNIIWKIIGFLLIMQIFYKLKTEFFQTQNGAVDVTLLNKKKNMSKYTNFKFDDKEFRDIVVAYLIVLFLMFGPNFMTIISTINLYFLNNFNSPTHGIINLIYELFIFIITLLNSKKRYRINWSKIGWAIVEILVYLLIVSFISVLGYYALYIPVQRTLDRINKKVDIVPIFFEESIYKVILYEIILFIVVGVIGQMTYVESTGDRSSLYYNYDTLDIIKNFNNTINIGKIGSIQAGGSIGKIFNYKNIFTIVILCSIIFALNKIKKNPENIMSKKKKDKIQKGGNEFFSTFIFKHLLGDTSVENTEENDYMREIGISILIIVIIWVLMKLGISNSILNQLEKEIFYDSNYILLLVLIMIPSCRYVYSLYNSYKENKNDVELTEYIKYHFTTKYTKIMKKNGSSYLDPDKQYELHDSKLELKIHTLLAAIIGIFLSLALNLTNNTKNTIIISISIILFLIFSNFTAYIIWTAFIKNSKSLFSRASSSDDVIIKYVSKNIEENGKIINTNNNINKEEQQIINKIKTDIIKDINKIKTSFNIKENIVVGLDDILNKWIYERYTHKSSGTYVDTVKLRKNLNKLNSIEKLDKKQEDEKEILNRHEEYKNLYDGVWEKTTNSEKKNIVERILIKTYGSRHAVGMSFNNAGYIVKKYNLRMSILNESSNGKNNIKLYDIDNPDFVLSTEDINNVKYINYQKYNSYYKKLIDMGSDIKNIETFLTSSNDFFKKINYILDPVKDVSYIIKYKLLEDFNEYRKIENDANKKCLSSLLIQRIYKKILLIKCITEEKYEEAEQLQNDLNVIEIKYNDLSLLSINRNDISLAVGKATDGSGIIEINISMTNLIGNVLKFKIIDDIGVLEHKHIHKDNDEHKHTFNYFKELLDILISRLNSASDKAPINNEINDLRDGILDYQSLSVEKQNAYTAYINARKDTNTTAQRLTELEDEITKTPVMNYNPTITSTGKHDNKHIHINKGPEQLSDVKENCDLKANDVPQDIYNIMDGDNDIKTYKYDIDNKEHQLVLSDNIKSEKLERIVNSLKASKFTNFYTGHLEFNLEYVENSKVKSKPYKIDLLGKEATLELEKTLSLKTKSYLKNIKVEGYYFDSDADNRCETTLVIKNNISSLIVDTYDMTDEFCI